MHGSLWQWWMATFVGVCLISSSAPADLVIEGNEFTPASEFPFPSPGPAILFHSDDSMSFGNPPDLAEVGGFDAGAIFQEARGNAEFPLPPDLPMQTNAFVFFEVERLAGLFDGVGDPPADQPFSIFDIDIVTYDADFVEDLSDFDISPIGPPIATFTTMGLSVGQTLMFDITDPLNLAIDGGATAFGVRLQAATDPGIGAVTFETFRIEIIPEYPPLGLVAMGFGMIAAFRIRKRR